MLQNLKYSLLKKRFDKSLLQLEENRVISQKEIKTVGVITTVEIFSQVNIQKVLETTLKVANVKVFCFGELKASNESNINHFSKKDINWKGEFKQENLQNFLQHPYDLLIGYFNTNNLYLETAILQSKATFKVGFSDVNMALYELEIAERIENLPQFSKEVKKYLHILKKLKN